MTENGRATVAEYDAVVVGAGFAGMYMLYRLRNLGFSARVIERGDGVGGTWYWNRYPGARCDVESLDYQYSFSDELQREWDWTERYATQPEILQYANHVADRFDLRRDMEFETSVTSADWDDRAKRWLVGTDRGDRLSCKFLIAATGCLSASRIPDIKGRDTFKGPSYHTGQWPHEGVDFTGQRVGVIGTGSSAIQAIPVMAEQAAQLVVFQRTPNYSVPANQAPVSQERLRMYKENFAEIKQQARESRGGVARPIPDTSALAVSEEERIAAYEARWLDGGVGVLGAFTDLMSNREANDTAAEFVRNKIRSIVKDPNVAEKLAPKDYPIGTKRICVDTNYFETYNRDNVALIDIRETPIEEITPNGVRTAVGEYEFDSIVFATGFDAMTGALIGMNITGRDGLRLADKWAAGPRSYLGIQVAGFPNLFTITGPGSPSVLSNMIVSIEQHVEWVSDCMEYLRTNGLETIEATVPAEDAWVDHVNQVGNMTLYPQANSWYMGANLPGKPRVFMPYVGGVGPYAKRCAEIAA
ncbi:MAG TPA: NAD(P)/FAD-dependent oxidoreductase, partial [Tepidiformaceae bacterium]|nr:NAD(P)/FAD-dependent oxidoreductase [Tepidiformaceae bacterium]